MNTDFDIHQRLFYPFIPGAEAIKFGKNSEIWLRLGKNIFIQINRNKNEKSHLINFYYL